MAEQALPRDVRGGLLDGHTHMAYTSRPVLKGKYPGASADCPACVLWAKELDDRAERSTR